MTDYALGFMRETLTDRLVLVRKNRPRWQSGLLNGAGGKIEAGEAPIDAMRREWFEEIGFEHHSWRPVAVLNAGAGILHVFAAELRKLPDVIGEPGDINDVGEAIETMRLSELLFRRDVVSNLRWLIPLAFEDGAAPFMTEVERAA